MTEVHDDALISSEILRLVRLAGLRPDREQLKPFLSHPDPIVRLTAVDVIAELRPSWGFDPLCLALLDASDRVREAAAEGLRPLQSMLPDEPQLFDFLEQASTSPSPTAREVAVRLLRRMSDAGVTTFVRVAGDPHPRVRIEAVRALTGFRAAAEIRALENDPDPAVRAEVAYALGQIADAQGAETLLRLAEDDDPDVRAAAVAALPAVCPRDRCDEVLLTAARDESGEVRQAALAALAAGGVSARRARRVLLDAIHDADHRVRAIARSALRRTAEQVA